MIIYVIGKIFILEINSWKITVVNEILYIFVAQEAAKLQDVKVKGPKKIAWRLYMNKFLPFVGRAFLSYVFWSQGTPISMILTYLLA